LIDEVTITNEIEEIVSTRKELMISLLIVTSLKYTIFKNWWWWF